MLPVTVLDASKYQARFLGDPTSAADQWDPAKWDTSVIDFDALLLGPGAPELVIWRIADGTRLDPCFHRFLAETVARGVPWAIYQLFRPNLDPVWQAALAREWCPLPPPAGMFGDLEVTGGLAGAALFDRTDRYLRALDEAFGRPAGVYSGAWFLDAHIAAELQRRWADRAGWWSGYPSLIIPAGWRGTARPVVLHQITDRHPWPGLPRPADASYFVPPARLSDLTGGAPDDGQAARVLARAQAILAELES